MHYLYIFNAKQYLVIFVTEHLFFSSSKDEGIVTCLQGSVYKCLSDWQEPCEHNQGAQALCVFFFFLHIFAIARKIKTWLHLIKKIFFWHIPLSGTATQIPDGFHSVELSKCHVRWWELQGCLTFEDGSPRELLFFRLQKTDPDFNL